MGKVESKLALAAMRDAADHIAILVHSLDGGGEQRRLISLAREFAAAGRKVDLYVPDGARDGRAALPADVSVRELRAAPGRGWLRRNDRAYAQALIEALVRDPPDVLLSGGAPMRIAIAAKARLPALPLVIRAGSHPRRQLPWRRLRQRLLEPIRRPLRSRPYGAADLVIAVANDVAAALQEMIPNVPVVALPSPIIGPKFIKDLARGPSHHPWLREDLPIVLSIGRFSVAKDFRTLLRAFALVRTRRPLRLVILGDGPKRYRTEAVKLARRLDIADDVAFPGWSSNVAGWLARASVFVSTSLWEGSPGVVIEAMAAGCPIVATDCPGETRRLLHGGLLGGLAPVGDWRRIAELIEMQLDEPTDPAALKAAAAPFGERSAAAAYLRTLDAFVSSFSNRMSKGENSVSTRLRAFARPRDAPCVSI